MQARVFAPFWSENGYTLCLFWCGIGYGFWGPTGVYERIYRFNSKWVRKKEKYANSIWIWIYIYFLFVCALANLGNGNNISAYGPGLKTGMDSRGVVWKRVWKITFFGLGSGFGEPGGTSPLRVPRNTPTLSTWVWVHPLPIWEGLLSTVMC